MTVGKLDRRFAGLRNRLHRCRTTNVLKLASLREVNDHLVLDLPEECGGQEVTYDALDLIATFHGLTEGGKRFVGIVGDSMLRQFTTRLIMAIRGWYPTIDYPLWYDLSYRVFENGDDIVIFHSANKTAQKLVGTHRPGWYPNCDTNGKRKCLVDIRFLWEPKYRFNFSDVSRGWTASRSSVVSPPGLLAHGAMYWDQDHAAMKAFFAGVNKLADEKSTHVLHLSTPRARVVRDNGYLIRNRLARSFLFRTSDTSDDWEQRSNVSSVGMLDVFRLFNTVKRKVLNTRRFDEMHFLCFRVTPSWLRVDKRRCRDDVNLALLRWMVTVFLTL